MEAFSVFKFVVLPRFSMRPLFLVVIFIGFGLGDIGKVYSIGLLSAKSLFVSSRGSSIHRELCSKWIRCTRCGISLHGMSLICYSLTFFQENHPPRTRDKTFSAISLPQLRNNSYFICESKCVKQIKTFLWQMRKFSKSPMRLSFWR